jgi:hypothetical protein
VLAPLYPHVQQGASTLVGARQFKVSTYVTRVSSTSDQGYFLTVLAEWTSANANNVPKNVAVRSRLYSPVGCSSSSTATRPFAGPCQAFFYSDAGTAPSGITVTSVASGAPLVTGTDVVRLEAKLPALSSRTQNEQIVSAQSGASTSRLLLKQVGDTTSGGQSATSAADTDPASGTGNSPASASAVSYSGSSTLSSSGSSVANFSISAPSSGSGSAYSTTTAAASPACRDDLGTGLVTNQACSSADLTPSGTYRATMDITMPGGGIKAVDLSSISTASGSPAWRSYGARAILPVSGHCASTSGIGCVASGARRSLGQATAGMLPSPGIGDTVPLGFSYMAQLNGFSATVSAESGISPAAPSVARGANMLTYWNGAGYSTAFLGNAGATYNLGTATGTYRLSGVVALTVQMSGRVVVDPASTATTGTAPCQSAACTSTATAGGVQLVVQYDISNGVGPVGSFVVTTDLGSTIAQTTYKAAPSA